MNTQLAAAVGARRVERRNGVEGSLDGLARELITEHKHADALIGRPIRPDRLLHARDGIGLAEGSPLLGAPADLGALLHGVGEPLALGVLEHVGTLVVHDLYTQHVRIGAQKLVDDRQIRIPVVIGHAVGCIDDEYDVLAVDGNPTDCRRRRPLRTLFEEPLHLGAQLLIRRDQLALHTIRDRGILCTAGILPANCAEIAGQASELLPLLLERRAAAFELASELRRLAPNGIELFGERPGLAVEVLTALFQHHGTTDLGQHEQQDNRAKAATDAVEKREAEHLHRAAPAHYGKSFAGITKLPSLVRARYQNRWAASGSPCMGNNTLSIGTC